MSQPEPTPTPTDLANAAFTNPIPPDFPDLIRHPSGAVLTSEGGIFLSVSSLKTWRTCRQKFFRSSIQGLRRRLDDGNLILGGVFGAGAETWLLTGDRKAAIDAADAEVVKRSPDHMIPAEEHAIGEFAAKARRWVNRFCESYPDPKAEINPICGEGPFYVRLPGGPHWLLGKFDLPFLRLPGGLGFTELKTTAETDKIRFLRNFEADDQVLAYSWAIKTLAQRIGVEPFGGTYLSVCVKPRKRKTGAEKDPEFWSQLLTPVDEMVELWARQATITADEIKQYLEITDHPDLWTRDYQRCQDYYRDCTYRSGCYQGEWGDLHEAGKGSIMDPFKIIPPVEEVKEEKAE